MKKLIFVFIFIFSFSLFADENQVDSNTNVRSGNLNLELLNMFILRNDTDFDRTEPYYNKYGQEMGLLGTFLKPMLSLRANESIRFYWEAEIGLDIWSQNNPDVGLDEKNSSYALGIKQREIYGEVNSDGFLLKVGFQRFMDLSTLFINHWIGALRLGYETDDYGFFFLTGEYPDQTFKGWDLLTANFMTDVFLFSLDGYYKLLDELKAYGGIYFIDDMHLIDRRRQITAFETKLAYKNENFDVSLAAVYMMGYRHKGGSDLSNTNISAYGFSLNSSYNYEDTIKAEAVFSYMSPDDKYEGNDSGAFLFSSRRAGPSLILSENDMRPIGDNYDKRIGAFDGVFYEMKSGLIGFDIGVYYLRDWLRVGTISGILLTANKDNSLDSNFVGWENDLLAEATFFNSLLSFQIIGGLMLPGDAGAAFINTTNRTEFIDSNGNKVSVTEPIYYIQSGILMKY